MTLKFRSFDWDDGNSTKSLKKHGVTRDEIEDAIQNAPIVYTDERHSTVTEKRYVAFCESTAGRQLFIVFTFRNKEIRIISARPMSRKERKWYEEEKKPSPF